MTFLDLRAAGLSEWMRPDTAAGADYSSAARLQSVIVAAMLDLANQIWAEEDRMAERKLRQQFDIYKSAGIILASRLRAERAED